MAEVEGAGVVKATVVEAADEGRAVAVRAMVVEEVQVEAEAALVASAAAATGKGEGKVAATVVAAQAVVEAKQVQGSEGPAARMEAAESWEGQRQHRCGSQPWAHMALHRPCLQMSACRRH